MILKGAHSKLESILGIGTAVAEGAAAAAPTAAATAAVQEVSPVVSLLFTFGPLLLVIVIF